VCPDSEVDFSNKFDLLPFIFLKPQKSAFVISISNTFTGTFAEKYQIYTIKIDRYSCFLSHPTKISVGQFGGSRMVIVVAIATGLRE